MDARQVDLLRNIDPGVLGARIKAARAAAGLTQKELGGDQVTVSYVSRIESGSRRPEPRVLTHLAERLGRPVEELLVGVSAKETEAVRLEVDFAELALELGDAKEAGLRLDDLMKEESIRACAEYDRARLLRARAFEATGDLDGAIITLEGLLADGKEGQLVSAGIALSRCYRESGDLTRAIQTGESVLNRLNEAGLTVGDEVVQLTVTVAAAYFEQGDTQYAVRMCRQATETADRFGSPRAQAAAYWNASVMEEGRGAIALALPLAERALSLLGEGQDSLNIARMRSQLGVMLLEVDPPNVSEAHRHLEAAASAYTLLSASPFDVLRNCLARAKAHFLEPDLDAAEALLGQVLSTGANKAPLIAAEANALRGEISAARGDLAAAKASYLSAVHVLSGIGADREAGQFWLDLGALLESVQEHEAARDAYRRAAVASGLTVKERIGRALPATREVATLEMS